MAALLIPGLLGLLLFLTSKVRLHCGILPLRRVGIPTWAFPDLKGQAPLRQAKLGIVAEVTACFS